MPAQKQPVQFGEWRPDVALLDTQFASEVENVFAGVNSYLPFPSLQAFGITALPMPRARCRASGKSTPARRPNCIRGASAAGLMLAARLVVLTTYSPAICGCSSKAARSWSRSTSTTMCK